MIRLDKILVEKNFFESRTRAENAILSGQIKINGLVVTKPSKKIKLDDLIEISRNVSKYVSRGAYKLIHALDEFEIDVKNLTLMDLGASTGGFSQVLLERNCQKVYCVDVGSNQLHKNILADKRVINLEKINIKNLKINHIPEKLDGIVLDVSFISLTKVIGYLPRFLNENAFVIALIKPQFEVGKNNLSKGGIVKNEKLYSQIISEIKEFAQSINFEWLSCISSPILGGDGNKEFLCFLRKSSGMDV
ncbi:MAG: TlyA family RNA methyltransferase [Crocinitomicaceae bacterium]